MLNLSQETRHYIYGVVGALIPLLVLFGLISSDEVQLYLNLAAAVLGLGSTVLAFPNSGKHVAVSPKSGAWADEVRDGDVRVLRLHDGEKIQMERIVAADPETK